MMNAECGMVANLKFDTALLLAVRSLYKFTDCTSWWFLISFIIYSHNELRTKSAIQFTLYEVKAIHEIEDFNSRKPCLQFTSSILGRWQFGKTAQIQARREGRGKLEGAYLDVRD